MGKKKAVGNGSVEGNSEDGVGGKKVVKGPQVPRQYNGRMGHTRRGTFRGGEARSNQITGN